MEELLPCPECGGQPKLNTLEPEYASMKYFCSNGGTHISCGDWKETNQMAVSDWNRRVQEYKDTLKVKTLSDNLKNRLKDRLSKVELNKEYKTDTFDVVNSFPLGSVGIIKKHCDSSQMLWVNSSNEIDEWIEILNNLKQNIKNIN